MAMTIDEWLENAKGGYEVAELEAAFDLVKNPENWKFPVDAIIDAAKRDVVDVAVKFYAGSVATFVDIGGGKLRVLAAGYYCDVG